MKQFITQAISAILLFSGFRMQAQCPAGSDSVYIDVITTNRGYEVYWQLVADTDNCGTGTIFEGGNLAQMNCNGANANVATPGNGYPNNDTITEGPFCLTTNNVYSIRFLDDSGSSDNHFIVRIKGLPVYHFHALNNTELFTFTVTPPLPYNVGMKKISTVSYITTNPVSISGKIFNYSLNTIHSLDVNYSVNGGGIKTDHVSGLNFAPYTELSFIHSTLFTPPSNGEYTVKVWVDNLDGNADMDNSNDTLYKLITTGSPVPNIVDLYLVNSPVFTQVADVNDQLDRPSDLDFHTILSRNELWVTNYADIPSKGSTVTFYNAGTPNQVGLWRQDSNADHFMLLPTALAFADNTNFANSSAVLDAHQGAGHFAGPVLWSSDSLIYCQPGPGPLGSHIDMLHQSPFAMGIAADHENAFWVYDGYNQCVTWYDFVQDHGPGFDDHTDGLVRRYTDFTLTMLNDSVPSHLVMDAAGLLYIVDNGNARVIRMDTHTGSITGSFTPYAEYVTEHTIVTGTTWNNYISTGLIQPSGIDVIGNRLIVTDYSNGDIIIYDNAASTGVELGRIHTGVPGIAGVKIGPDGKIWYVNMLTNQVFRVDGITVGENENAAVKAFDVYPNPASQQLNIRLHHFAAEGVYDVMLNDISGKLVYNAALTQQEMQIRTAVLDPGLYILSLSDGVSVWKEKVVITR
jgi:hypothetical protein